MSEQREEEYPVFEDGFLPYRPSSIKQLTEDIRTLKWPILARARLVNHIDKFDPENFQTFDYQGATYAIIEMHNAQRHNDTAIVQHGEDMYLSLYDHLLSLRDDEFVREDIFFVTYMPIEIEEEPYPEPIRDTVRVIENVNLGALSRTDVAKLCMLANFPDDRSALLAYYFAVTDEPILTTAELATLFNTKESITNSIKTKARSVLGNYILQHELDDDSILTHLEEHNSEFPQDFSVEDLPKSISKLPNPGRPGPRKRKS